LSIVDRLLEPHYLLSAFLAIHVHPGETAQGWHFDDGGCRVPLPRPMHGVSAIWALDDFTAENGATQVIPRSHLWGEDAPAPDSPSAVSICMPAGPGPGRSRGRGPSGIGAERAAAAARVSASGRSTANRGCARSRTWRSPYRRTWRVVCPPACRSCSATASRSRASWDT